MSEILELSVIGLIIVGIIVGYFYNYAKTYRTSDERLTELTQAAFMSSPVWDDRSSSTVNIATNSAKCMCSDCGCMNWKTAVAEGIIRNTDGTVTVKFKLPKQGTTGASTADYVPHTYTLMTSDWYGAPLQNYDIILV